MTGLEQQLTAQVAALREALETIRYLKINEHHRINAIAYQALSLTPADALVAVIGEPVGELHKAHAKPPPERNEHWCREVLLYSAGNPGDLPVQRMTVYQPPKTFIRESELAELRRINQAPLA